LPVRNHYCHRAHQDNRESWIPEACVSLISFGMGIFLKLYPVALDWSGFQILLVSQFSHPRVYRTAPGHFIFNSIARLSNAFMSITHLWWSNSSNSSVPGAGVQDIIDDCGQLFLIVRRVNHLRKLHSGNHREMSYQRLQNPGSLILRYKWQATLPGPGPKSFVFNFNAWFIASYCSCFCNLFFYALVDGNTILAALLRRLNIVPSLIEIFVILFTSSDKREYGTYWRELRYAVRAIRLFPYCTGAETPYG